MADTTAEFPGTFPGTIKAPLDIASLTKEADVICQGEVIHVADEGVVRYRVGGEPTPFTRWVASLRVDRVYKGTVATPVIEIEFLQPDFPSSMEKLDQGEYVLVFLRRVNTRYQFANATTSKIPIRRDPPPVSRGGRSPLAAIRQALIYSLGDTRHDVVLA